MAYPSNEFRFDEMRGARPGTILFTDPVTNELVLSCERCGADARYKADKLMTLHLAHEPWCPVIEGPSVIAATAGGKRY